MKRNKKVVEIAYKYEIEYEHEEHFNELLERLLERPSFGCRGSGGVSEGNGSYGYSVELMKGGRIIT
jgi:hypothetical protein